MGSTETVVVGSGAIGGTAATTNDTNGNSPLNQSGSTTFSLYSAVGGNNGTGGGTATTASAGVGKFSKLFYTSTAFGAGGTGTQSTGTSGVAVAEQLLTPTGGGGGGGAAANGSTTQNGGSGGAMTAVSTQSSIRFAIAGGAAGDRLTGTQATSGTSATNELFRAGTGGGGGFYRYNLNPSGGDGASGGWPGGGGGGGGAGDNNFISGAGGNGANGVAVIITYF